MTNRAHNAPDPEHRRQLEAKLREHRSAANRADLTDSERSWHEIEASRIERQLVGSGSVRLL
jgi:hypothetical protein